MGWEATPEIDPGFLRGLDNGDIVIEVVPVGGVLRLVACFPWCAGSHYPTWQRVVAWLPGRRLWLERR